MFLPFVFALLVSCTKAELADPPSAPTSVNKSILLQLVNDVRKTGCQCGDTWYGPAPALSWNAQLETAALEHSNDMKQKKYFSHEAPDGSDAGDRILRTGYQWSAFGENIGMGYANEQAVIRGWLSSPGHCRNIMGKLFKEMGVARSGSYWTMVVAGK